MVLVLISGPVHAPLGGSYEGDRIAYWPREPTRKPIARRPEEQRRRPILSRLKRLLRRLRPVLLPIRRRIRPFVERSRPRPPQPIPTGPIVAPAAGPTTGRPIRSLRKPEFDRLAARYPYYRARWEYMSVACAAADELIERYRLRTALELGPHLRSVIVGADVMDLRVQPDLEAEGRTILHDATDTPWPIGDKQYELFVGLQVFEHLRDRQHPAFLEVCRVAQHAVISLPIDWEMGDPTNCHHRISHERALSWFAPVVPTRVEVGNPGPKKRLVYVFENLQGVTERSLVGVHEGGRERRGCG